MTDAEQTLGKPVLLEEFGKRLIKGADAQLFADAIDHLRNPVFKTTYDLVTAAIQMCDPCSLVPAPKQSQCFWWECCGGVSMHLRQRMPHAVLLQQVQVQCEGCVSLSVTL